ncbi:helix-turn-helix domain-containing protein [Anaerococcus martiniensis]|uniref:helix-turn-helix domain-containing protein n=1 Tax=Anaerococcus sp. WGS1579 TaxID=3366809 RepID=UPI00372D4C7D
MHKEDLKIDTGMSSTTLVKLGKNKIVSMDILSKICGSLKCYVRDICEYKMKGDIDEV